MKFKILFYIFSFVLLSGCIGKKPQNSGEAAGTISLSNASALNTLDNSLTYTVAYTNAKEITLAIADIQLIKTGTVAGTVSVSGDGLSTRTVTVSSISGAGTLAIKIAAGTAVFSKTKKAVAVGPSAAATLENLSPAINISAPSLATTKNGTISFTVVYSGAETVYLDETFISLSTDDTATGTVSVSGVGAIKTVTISGISGSGTLGITIAADSAVSTAGKYSLAMYGSTYCLIDSTPPVISIAAPSASTSKSGPVSYSVSYTESPMITLASTDITLNKTGTANGVVSVTGGGTALRTVSVSSLTGDGTLAISLAANTAVDAVGNTTLAFGPSSTFIVDNTPPGVVISAPSVATTNSGPVTYTVTYSGASAITLSSANIVLNKTGTANASVSVTGSGSTTRTVTLFSTTGDGTIGISVDANTAIDAAGNYASAPTTSSTFIVDNTSSGITLSAPSIADTSTTPVTYTVTYADAATISLVAADVQLITTGTANAVASITGSGSVTRTVTLSSLTGSGTIAIKLIAGTAIDNSGNTTLASATSATFNVDSTRPTVAISSASTSVANSGPITYTITYTGASVITLANTDIVLNKTSTADGTAVVSGTGTTTRTVTISSITGNGTLGISLLADTAFDAAGNSVLASGASTTFTVDNTSPTMSIQAPSKAATATASVVYTATYTGASTISLVTGNVTLVKTGSADGTVSVAGTGSVNRTISISGITGHGTLGVTVVAGTAVDSAGNLAGAPTAPETFYVTNDPLFPQSWHLYNIGQTGYSTGTGYLNFDLNVVSAWKAGYTGTGIKILVSDTGVQSAHEDLSGNFLGGTVSHDFVNGSAGLDYVYATAEPILAATSSDHGTSVAGIIAAAAGNSIGGQGIAPNAQIASANLLALTTIPTTAQMLVQLDNSFDIINQSWGTTQCTVSSPDAAYESKMASERKVYIKSAGDDFAVTGSVATCGRITSTRHGNAVLDTNNNNPYIVVVAALNANGVKSSSSSPGSSVWITGLGGERGFDSPAILSTDLSGCTYGASPADTWNVFQLSSHPLNTSCNYTATMNGTSAAAPTISGVVALMLQANPALTTRDVKHILASTAVKVNATAAATTNSYVASPAGHVWQQGWVTNAALYQFHNYYGFGLANAKAAVEMAATGYVNMAAEVQTGYASSGVVSLAIPDNSATGVEAPISVAATLTVEAIQIKLAATHANIGELGLEVTSPSGTKSIILNVNNSLDGLIDFDGTEVFLSNAFYGENSVGSWKIKLIDGKASTAGQLVSWEINVIGH
jgi:subtilisin-like proprotein convertase family protein